MKMRSERLHKSIHPTMIRCATETVTNEIREIFNLLYLCKSKVAAMTGCQWFQGDYLNLSTIQV